MKRHIWVLKVRDENTHNLGCQSEYCSFLGFMSADNDWRFLVCVSGEAREGHATKQKKWVHGIHNSQIMRRVKVCDDKIHMMMSVE